MGMWIMAQNTFKEAARRKLLWTALILGLGFLAIFALGMKIQMDDATTRAVQPFLRYQILDGMLLIGLYTVDLLALVMTILTSIDSIAGEISSGTIDALATKPVGRWEILMGKWIGFAAMIGCYVLLMFGGMIGIGYWITGVVPQNPVQGALLVYLECLVALTVSFLFGTWFSALTNGVIVLGLCGLAFMGGWLEQMSGFTESAHLVLLGVISSLIMPSEAIWRRAAYEMQSPVAGSLPFSPFSNISVPSNTMIGYACVYLVVALAAALFHFQSRDL
ncbi:MAG TPA: ABC transporter permease [Terracidiphilus sp.]|nr:ABC transporter permease [Terracidiphilus sp.]